MLQSFYIIDRSGIGVFEYHNPHLQQKEHIEFQLLTGLITALIEFSQTTLMDSIQVIKLLEAKLAFTQVMSESNYYGIGLYSVSDHDIVIKRANTKIFREFLSQKKKYFLIGNHSGFNEELQKNFQPLRSLRYYKFFPMCLPIDWKYVGLVSSATLALMFILYLIYPPIFTKIIQKGITDAATYYLSFVVYGIPYFITAFLIGRRFKGFVGAVAVNTIFTSIIVCILLSHTPFSQLKLEGIDFTYVLSMILGFLGGIIGEFVFINDKK